MPAILAEPARTTPIVHDCDLCVVGGSCTGLFAAVRAARLGLRVAIVEQANCFGGVATLSLVNVWHSLLDTQFEQPIIAGLTLEIEERLRRREALTPVDGNPSIGCVFNSEELKIELDELAREAGLRVFFHTLFAAPHVVDGRLEAVLIENKSGRAAIRASQFIDATGDGDLAARLGLETYAGEHGQPATTCARFGGWESLGGLDLGAELREHGDEFRLPPGFAWGDDVPGGHSHMLAGTRVYEAATPDPMAGDALTAAELEGRRQVRALQQLLRAVRPDSRVTLEALASRIGVREARHVRCLYQLTGDDVLSGRRFPDAVANGSYRVDIHHRDQPGVTFRYLDGTEEHHCPGKPCERGRWRAETTSNPTFYQVPLRSLLTGLPNVSVAGRMLDADAAAHGAVRVMVNLNQCGEAAGVAAALALGGGRALPDVDPQEVRRALAAGGSVVL